jgi:tRNA A-37 threonylcarbamoyl transferase component Bud32
MDTGGMTKLSQGAEAILYLDAYLGTPCVIKQRVSKAYRVEVLDKKINKQRFLQEIRNIYKCKRHHFKYSCAN